MKETICSALPKFASSMTVLSTTGIAILLRTYPPSTSSFYPQCPFHQATGLLCPGCGGTRALAALLHGRLIEAFADNALVVLLLPALAAYVAVALFRRLAEPDAVWPRPGNVHTYALLALTMGYAVWRNLP